LTPAQIRYAFDDVRFLLPLWERLSLRLDKLNRLGWAREEFERLRSNTVPQANKNGEGPDRWRKLRGAGTLDRRRLAVVRELYYWREEQAARSNRPARTILRDDLLVEVARRNPTKVRDLQVVRGLPKRSLEALVQAVQKARAVPLEECPEVAEQDQDPPQLALVTNLLNAALGDLCIKEQLASSLVASNQDLKLLIRSYYYNQPLSRSCLLAQGWRSTHVLPVLQSILEGRRGIRIGDLRSEAPFHID
jgi:ribonuclease D